MRIRTRIRPFDNVYRSTRSPAGVVPKKSLVIVGLPDAPDGAALIAPAVDRESGHHADTDGHADH